MSAYLNAQIESGVQAVMLFDTWGGALSHAAFHEFSLPYLRAVLERLHRSHDGQIVPRTVFTKGGGLWLESLADTGADCVGLDWTIGYRQARADAIGHKVALQGNLDPGVLFATPEVVRNEAAKVLAGYGAGQRPRLQSGPWRVAVHAAGQRRRLVDAVHELSRSYHQPLTRLAAPT